MPTTVLLVEDHELFRLGLRHLIDRCDDLQVLAEVETAASAIAYLQEATPDVVVLDLMLADGCGTRVLQAVQQEGIATRVLVLTGRDDREWADRAMSAGAAGFVDKAARFDEVIAAIRAIAAGRTVISYKHPSHTPHDSTPKGLASDPTPAKLSAREHEVLACIAQGHTNQEAADKLFLSVKTIETYRSRLTRKLGVRGRSELFKAAQQAGLL